MTLAELFDRTVATHPRDIAVTAWTPTRSRNLSMAALAREVSRLAAGLIALGVKKGDRVLLISENRPEWTITDYATVFCGGILVPVYPSLTAEQIRYILDNSGATIAIASTQELLDRMLAALAGLGTVRQSIVFDQDAAGEEVMHLTTVQAMGDDLLVASPGAWREPAGRLRDTDVATIIYTSGTTGPPKGVMLTHGNIVSNVEGLSEALEFGPGDTALSFLPLCHITQRVADCCYLSQGARIVHVKIDHVGDAMRAVQPTTFVGVPRVYEKARDGIVGAIAGRPAPTRALARWAHGVGKESARGLVAGTPPSRWLRLRHAVADRLVLSRVRRGMGGRLVFVNSGGAPLNPDVMEFFLALGVPILEGYGLTETTVLTVNRRASLRPGTVGLPVKGVELRVEADGEIVARGPGIARGYYLDVKRTDEVFADGWCRTGDLGRFDEAGRLMITGRKKELLVTSGGKKVSPALIEQDILRDPLVSQVVLVGDGRKFVSALLVPERGRLLSWCRERGLLGADGNGGEGGRAAAAGDGRRNAHESGYERLLDTREVHDLYEEIIHHCNERLARFEQIKRFALLPTEFTQEGGELTPTLKVMRRVVEEKYRHLIESMYAGTQEG